MRGATRVRVHLLEAPFHGRAVRHHGARTADERRELVAHYSIVGGAARGFGRLDGDRGAESIDLDDVRHCLVLETQRNEAAAQDGDERQLGHGGHLPPAPGANEIEIAIVPFAPGLDVRVQVLHDATRCKRDAFQRQCQVLKCEASTGEVNRPTVELPNLVGC
jgi:hypothetical protein